MIIREIRIKNFRSYYGEKNIFDFSDGLTIIIGDNGDGKTTFFEALHWLLNTTPETTNILLDNISEMRKSKMEPGDLDEVSVFMRFDHYGEKTAEKSFTFEKLENGGFRISKPVYRGYETNASGRESVNGQALIERCYDAFIQRFSMFKGESELNVFDNKTALKELVDKFSDIHQFDELVQMTETFEDKSNKAYLKEFSLDRKIAGQARDIEKSITELSAKISVTKNEIRDKRFSIDTYNRHLSDLEENKEAAENYKDIKSRLKTQEDKRNKFMANIESVNYNHALLDKMWILAPYIPVLNEFQEKVAMMSKTKRKMDRDFLEIKAKAKGKLEAIKEIQGVLQNGATELPWYLPDAQTMEDMIKDHICKVCNREAPEGSEAYNFMVRKLEDYKRHAEAKLKRELEENRIDEQELFLSDHIEKLHNMSVSMGGVRQSEVSGYAQEISDRQELVARFQEELKKTNNKIQDIKDEMARLLIHVGNVAEDTLEKNFSDIRGLYNQRERATNRLAELENESKHQDAAMAKLKAELAALDPASSQAKVMRDVHAVLEEIAKAFAQAKKDNLARFLSNLEEKANDYLVKLSASDFHGEVRLRQTADESTEIRLFSSNGTEIRKPSGSQKTVMYISVLFAISDFTLEKREEDYPLIFDAATSSFGDSKEGEFYNVINTLRKQCIIVTKDFIEKGNLNEVAINGLDCMVYRIRKAPTLDPSNMATVRTLIEKIR